MTESALRPYRLKSKLMGQTSPPGLGHVVVSHVLGSSVADVGCGSGVTGYLLRAAWEFSGAWYGERVVAPTKLVGVDWSSSTVDALRRHGPYDETHLATSSTVPLPDRSVDTAISMENLEHLLPDEVPVALCELRRISRRQVVLSTPAPWAVTNEGFLTGEIREADADKDAMGYEEFMNLVGQLHKSSVTPAQMRAAGFVCSINRLGAVQTYYGSVIYTADPDRIDAGNLGEVTGIDWKTYPVDDGRADWREEYLATLRASLAMATPRKKPIANTLSEIGRAVRESPRV